MYENNTDSWIITCVSSWARCLIVRCVLPAVVLFSGWRVNSSDHFALLWEPHKQNRSSWLISAVLSCLVFVSMVLHKPCHVIDTVGGYPLVHYSDLEKWTLPFVLTNRADESLRGLWRTLPRIAASDSGICILPLALHPRIQCHYFLIHPGLKAKTLSQGLAACGSVTWRPTMSTLHCALGHRAEWGKNSLKRGARPNCKNRTFQYNERKR